MPLPTADASAAALEAQVFWLRYRKEIAGLLVVGVLAICVFGAWRFIRDRREVAASAAFAAAKNPADYEQIVDRYGDTPAAASAYLLLADTQRKGGKIPNANATLERFLEKFSQHELASTARMSIAANLETMGKQDEAIAAYQQIAAGNPNSFNAPLALLAQAQILQVKNRSDEARRICETILMQYRQSYASMEASQLLKTLKPANSPAPTVSPGSSPEAFPKP